MTTASERSATWTRVAQRVGRDVHRRFYGEWLTRRGLEVGDVVGLAAIAFRQCAVRYPEAEPAQLEAAVGSATRNAVVDFLRSLSRSLGGLPAGRNQGEPASTVEELPSEAITAEDAASNQEIRRLVEALPDAQRRVLALHYGFEGDTVMPLCLVAKTLRLGPMQVLSFHSRALAFLAEKMVDCA